MTNTVELGQIIGDNAKECPFWCIRRHQPRAQVRMRWHMGWVEVYCDGCGGATPFVRSEEEAIKLWNETLG